MTNLFNRLQQYTELGVTDYMRDLATESAKRKTLSSHEWNWTQEEQEAMALYILDLLQTVDALKAKNKLSRSLIENFCDISEMHEEDERDRLRIELEEVKTERDRLFQEKENIQSGC